MSKDGASHLAESDPTTVKFYFHYYARLTNQMNMLQDLTRTKAYQKAVIGNPSDFRGKTVMDVGAGSGILSFFSAQAGADRVFAVEASQVARAVEVLKASNPLLGTRLTVLMKPVEAVTKEELANPFMAGFTGQLDQEGMVDVLISEPIGTFLFNERMIESYLHARDRFLKPGGKMFPNKANLNMALFSDAPLYAEVCQKATFWQSHNFFGVDISALSDRAFEESFEQPILDYVNRQCLVSEPVCESFDFESIPAAALQEMTFPIDVVVTTPTLVHGIAGWFDIIFEGSEITEILSTAPWAPPTHWHQIRFLLKQPLAVNPSQRVTGTVHMKAHAQQSYYVKIRLGIFGTDIVSESATVDLKDPDYRWFNANPPPA